MKTLFSILIAVCLIFAAPMAFAIENGAGLKFGQVTLLSAATGTTSAYNTSAYTFDNVMKYGACDIISGLSYTTGNITFTIDGNEGSSTSLYDTGTVYLVTSSTLASSLTLTVMKTVRFASGVAAPFRTIRATVTAPSTTQVITINCSAIQ